MTLVGPPGIGKTRVSLQVAVELRDAFADGTCFVDLAPISDPDLVASAIAQALGVKEAGRQVLLASLRQYLQDKRLLIVLDNFEQVLDAVPLVVELLAASAELKLLVTSREALRIQGEHQFPVPPLALPELAGPLPVELVARTPAVALFVAVAQTVTPDFRLTDANAATVAAICAAVDGLPLAIELVAARSTLLSPSALLARLQRPDGTPDTGRLVLLTRGPRDLPARQQTLHSAISWSYDLLTPALQGLFAQLGVFVGGCTLAAVEAVCTPPAGSRGVALAERPGAGAWDPLDGVAALLDKSLLKHAPGAGEEREPRVTMLETLRAFALERLGDQQDDESVRRRHAAYYLALAEAAEPKLMDAEHGQYLHRLELEQENLRAALRWSLTADAALALRLGGALWRFWLLQSRFSEGRRWLEAALAATPPTPHLVAARAKALNGAGVLAHYQGDYGRAAVLCGESLTLSRHAADPRAIAAALRGLALVARSAHNYGAARAMYQESLALSRELGDRWSTAASLCHLGLVELYDADYAAARPVLEESLALYSAVGDRAGLTLARHCLGIVSWGEGDHPTAWALMAEALAFWQAAGDRRYVALSLQSQGRVASATGDFAAAQALFEESLAILVDVGDTFECSVDAGGAGRGSGAGRAGPMGDAAARGGSRPARRAWGATGENRRAMLRADGRGRPHGPGRGDVCARAGRGSGAVPHAGAGSAGWHGSVAAEACTEAAHIRATTCGGGSGRADGAGSRGLTACGHGHDRCAGRRTAGCERAYDPCAPPQYLQQTAGHLAQCGDALRD